MSTQIEARRLSGEQRSLFDRTDDEMRAKVAEATRRYVVLQKRIVAARHYVLAHGADPGLLAILGGDEQTIHDDRTTTPTPKETP